MIEGFASCVLVLSEVSLQPVDTGWKEHALVTVEAQGSCPWVDVPLPPGVTLDRWKARTKRVTGRSGKLKSVREERIHRDHTGRGAVRIHTPELATGDRVELDLTRTWPAVAYPWQPGGQSFAEIFVDTPQAPPDWARDEDGSIWTQDAASDVVWAVPHPSPTAPYDAPLAPTEPVDVTLTYDLIVPGNAQFTLYPGGGSRYRQTWQVTGAAESGRQGFVVPIEGKVVEVEGEHEVREDSVLLVATDGAPFDHTVVMEAPDAPTYGVKVQVPGANVKQVVKGERVRIEWEREGGWYVSAVDLKPLLPERPRLLRALDRRFRRMASPEPAVPTFLKGKPTNLELVAQLKPALRERTGIGWPTAQPLFPRKLVRSRNQHAMSTVEAALALWTELAQLQIPSAWGIVMPAPVGEGFFMSPAGYEVGVVGVQTPSGSVWIDPGCNLCAPFELRPHLEGAAMLSPAGRFTPDPTPGAASVRDQPGEDGGFTRTVHLEGPAALLERQRLARVPRDGRKDALVDHWCGDCSITAQEGLGAAGEPITLTFTSEALSTVDPLDASHLASDFDGWHDWVGTRSWTRPSDLGAASWSEEPVAWSREAGEDGVVEQLAFEARRLPEGMLERWTDARAAAPQPAEAGDEAEVGRTGSEGPEDAGDDAEDGGDDPEVGEDGSEVGEDSSEVGEDGSEVGEDGSEAGEAGTKP